MYRLYFMLVFVHLSLKAQTTIAQDFNTTTTFVGIDYLNQFYYLKNGHTLLKKGENLELQYTNIALGTITNVDITNPLEIVVYYHDFNTVIILDRSLNKIDTIHFFGKNIGFATKATANKLWLYNTETQKIELYNYKTEKTELTSETLFKEAPIQFKSDFNHVYVLTKDYTLIAFDSFLSNHIIAEDITIDAFAIDNKHLVLKNKNTFFELSKKGIQKIAKVDIKSNITFCIKNDTLFIFDGNQIQRVIIPKFD